MTEGHDFAGRIAGWWVGLVDRHAARVAAAILIATVLIGIYVVRDIGINTSSEDMLSRKLPFRQNSLAVDREFPQLSDNMAVVLDGTNPDAVNDAAALLAREFREYPDILGDVFDPADEPALRKNGLLFKSQDELSGLLDRLVAAQPFIGRLWNDPTLVGLFNTLELVIEQGGAASDSLPLAQAGDLFRSVAAAIQDEANGRHDGLSWTRLFEGTSGTPKREFHTILLRPKLDYGEIQPANAAMAKVHNIADVFGIQEHYGVRVRITGSVAMEDEELQTLADNMGLASVMSFLITGVLLALGMRSLVEVTATMITLFVGLVLTAGWATVAVGQLNLISVAFAILFIGLGEDFGVHFCLRAREELRAGAAGRRQSYIAAGRHEGGALALSAATAAIAFFSFVPTDYRGLAELGIIAGGGMFIALFTNLTLLPALLALWPEGRAKMVEVPPMEKPSRWDLRRIAKPGAIVITALTLISLFLLPGLRFDFDPLDLRDPHTESVSTLFDMMQAGEGSPYTIDILEPNESAAEQLGERIAHLPTVDRVLTLGSFIPTDQEDKLAAVESAAFTLLPALSTKPLRTQSSEDERLTAFTSLRRAVSAYIAAHDSDEAPLTSGIHALNDALLAFATKTRLAPEPLAALEHTLTGSLPARLGDLKLALQPQPFTADDVPPALRARMLAEDGHARIEVTPKEDMHDRNKLRAFVTQVRTLAPNASGGPVTILEAGDAVMKAFAQAGTWSIGVITLLTIVLLRRIRDVVLIYVPLIFAAILTVGISVAFDMPFNFANVIVLPLLFGLGIASGIHLVMREREEGMTLGVAETSTPRAVFYSTLTTIGSFGTVAFSDHRGVASMGILLTVAILLTLVCSLTVLPVLLEKFPLSKPKPPAEP